MWRPARIVAVLAAAVVLLGSGMAWLVYHWVADGLMTSDALDSVRGRGPGNPDDSVNLLLIGLDSRKSMNGDDLPRSFVRKELHAGSSEIGGYNTNTLILVHIPPGGGRVTAFSIPRDDYVRTATGDGTRGGMHKIKEAYGRAKAAEEARLVTHGVTDRAELERRGRESGRRATLATVQDFLGLPIDHFAEVSLLGFYDIAHVLQPLQVCLKRPVRDSYSGANFPAGVSSVDAAQALAFVRQRHGLPEGDLDRTHRQQAFLASVSQKLRGEGIWDDLDRLDNLLGAVRRDVVLDRGWDLLDFLRQAPGLTGVRAVFHTLPIAAFANRGGESVNVVDLARVRRVVREAIARDDAPSSTRPTRLALAAAATPASAASPAATPPDARRAAARPARTPWPVPTGDFIGPAVTMGGSGIPCVN